MSPGARLAVSVAAPRVAVLDSANAGSSTCFVGDVDGLSCKILVPKVNVEASVSGDDGTEATSSEPSGANAVNETEFASGDIDGGIWMDTESAAVNCE